MCNRFVIAVVASMDHIEIHSVDFYLDLRIDSPVADTTLFGATVVVVAVVLLVAVKMVLLDFHKHIHFAFVHQASASVVVAFYHSLTDHH